MESGQDLVNKGFIVNRPDQGGSEGVGRTFIVTGLNRSGTTLVAAMLRHAAIFMGTEINDIVHEDEAIARTLIAADPAVLNTIIADRNANYGTWGFKFPMLCDCLKPHDLARFNRPRVIVMFRDPVSVAVRNALSQYREPMRALQQSMVDLNALMTFVSALTCPTLLASYEKALSMPAEFVDAIADFCGLPPSDTLRARLVALIEPNRPDYIIGARSRYEGNVERIADGHLVGWGRLTGSSEPVELELLFDDTPILTFTADLFRQDLLDAGFSQGRHGFQIQLGSDVPRDTAVRVRVAHHEIELDNSGRRLAEYIAEPTKDQPPPRDSA